ncbi:MAG: phosphotransferase [Calditrichaeota bacterium]|nr:phosphotransferase [Calditrichota bacterium]
MMNAEQKAWINKRFPIALVKELPIFGSQRKFYRIQGDSETRVVIIDGEIEQFRLFIDRGRLFRGLNVNIPEVFDYSEKLHIILETDLGDRSLELIAHETNDRITYYKQVIDLLVHWQKSFDNEPGLKMSYQIQTYDFDFARHDTRLFTERYLRGYLSLSQSKVKLLDTFFDDLAERTANVRSTLMHRDFQARNIHWYRDKPNIVDFQAAVVGPYTYDIASLIFDNHVDISQEERSDLLDYFFRHYPECDKSDLYAPALQRTLQAIGAYAFLSKVQGKRQYEQYIPNGVSNLRILQRKFDWIDIILN